MVITPIANHTCPSKIHIMKKQLFQAPRGTSDVMPEDQPYWRSIENSMYKITNIYGYDQIETPVFEDSGLFIRGVGEDTDIIEKETYTFEDRGGNLLTLRPEGTAPICRAYLEHGMQNKAQPVRLFYYCPMFRFDRPQAGRYRQLNQFGIELIGEKDASVDAEIIELAWNFFDDLGLIDNVSLLVNSIGDEFCRGNYIIALQKHYTNLKKSMIHQECIRRLETNPLRLLDCKESSCQDIIQSSPSTIDYLCKDCLVHWETLLKHLEQLQIPYIIDNRLVRGLDYYTRTVFEIVPPEGMSQGTILAGGRYDGLIEQLGGDPTPGIGFATGIERIILNLKKHDIELNKSTGTKILVAYLGMEAQIAGIDICSNLRSSGQTAVLAPSGRGLKSQLRYASSIQATHSVIIGTNELETQTFILRDMISSTQTVVHKKELLSIFVEA